MIKHYEGELGIFDYDDEEFEISTLVSYIKYRGKGLSVDLPKGCISTNCMFSDCVLPKGFTLGDFDTSEVIDMDNMFKNCIFSEGFTLGDKFNTSKACSMEGMFFGCELPRGFSLGDKFDTSNVKNISHMFGYCKFPKNFTLGRKFSMNKVEKVVGMFQHCNLPLGAPDTENPFEIVNWLKFRDVNNTENISNEHIVWKILNQALYTEEFFPQAEKMYDFIKSIVNTCGYTTVNGNTVPTMQLFFDMWNNYSTETFKILDALVHEYSSEGTQPMNLF